MSKQNEPTTGEIVRALKYCSSTSCAKACPRFYTTTDGAKCARTLMKDAAATIAALTARAEQDERERDAAKADMKLIADEVREKHCDNTCCFVCKFDCDTSKNDSGEFENECPGFDRDDCFEWRGLQPQDGGMK